jgi:hypothetical protein
MVSSKLLLLKDRYQNGKDDIGKDLIEPCLSECTHYRRGTGFFSSSALKAYASAMSHVIGNKVKIDILGTIPILFRLAIARTQRSALLIHIGYRKLNFA